MTSSLTKNEIERAARALLDARLSKSVIDGLPPGSEPRNLADAYAIQDRLIELLDWEIGGWFCACTNRDIQNMLGLSEPYYARLLKRDIAQSPARLRQSDYPPIVIESEFSFLLQADLPARPGVYSRAEVEAAIASVHPSIEVVAGHLRDWPRQSAFAVIADNGTDGALIHGEMRSAEWRSVHLPNLEVKLFVNGKQTRRGRGANVLGDPVIALVWLANARSKAGDGLKAGHIHNTGTATSIQPISAGDSVLADFGVLGQAELCIE
jgi:2-keto-4-pentenoate hydratase